MEPGEVPEPFWTFWKRDKSLVPAGDVTLDHMARRLVTKPTEFSQLLEQSFSV